MIILYSWLACAILEILIVFLFKKDEIDYFQKELSIYPSEISPLVFLLFFISVCIFSPLLLISHAAEIISYLLPTDWEIEERENGFYFKLKEETEWRGPYKTEEECDNLIEELDNEG